jgi:hypothetical protein
LFHLSRYIPPRCGRDDSVALRGGTVDWEPLDDGAETTVRGKTDTFTLPAY